MTKDPIGFVRIQVNSPREIEVLIERCCFNSRGDVIVRHWGTYADVTLASFDRLRCALLSCYFYAQWVVTKDGAAIFRIGMPLPGEQVQRWKAWVAEALHVDSQLAEDYDGMYRQWGEWEQDGGEHE